MKIQCQPESGIIKKHDRFSIDQVREMQKQQEIEEAEDAALDFADSF